MEPSFASLQVHTQYQIRRIYLSPNPSLNPNLGIVLQLLRGWRVLGWRVVDARLADVDGDALLGRLPAQRADQLLLPLCLARRSRRRLLPLARGLLEKILLCLPGS